MRGFGQGRAQGLSGRKKAIMIASSTLVACMVAILIIALRYNSGASAHSEDPSASLGTVKLFVAERPIFVGQTITEAKLRETLWPRSQIPAGAIRDRAELNGKYAKVDLPAGIPLQISHLTSTQTAAVLPVTPGNRAVTIEVDATSGLEGLALPGTRVDCLLTFSQEGNLKSKVIVQNARVLSSGGNTQRFSEQQGFQKSRSVKPVKTVTLDVSPKDALTIRTASQLGRLSLVMRSTDDTGISVDTEITASQLNGITGDDSGPRTITPGCTKGFYRINGQEFQLGCDGTRFEVDNIDEP